MAHRKWTKTQTIKIKYYFNDPDPTYTHTDREVAKKYAYFPSTVYQLSSRSSKYIVVVVFPSLFSINFIDQTLTCTSSFFPHLVSLSPKDCHGAIGTDFPLTIWVKSQTKNQEILLEKMK